MYVGIAFRDRILYRELCCISLVQPSKTQMTSMTMMIRISDVFRGGINVGHGPLWQKKWNPKYATNQDDAWPRR